MPLEVFNNLLQAFSLVQDQSIYNASVVFCFVIPFQLFSLQNVLF